MLASIIINNFNYGRYVGHAIDSALAQTHPDVEVVVCDDGSTDDSWAVIQAYGDRVRALRTARNCGQASAMNLGLAHSRGEFVLFLDADDQLDPEAVSTCLPLLAAADVAKVQFRLRCVDAEQQGLGRQIPYLMHDGDVRPLIARYGAYAGPPSSGNFYRRTAIAEFFPLDEACWRRAADTPPFLLSPFFGRVVNAPRALGRYRLHNACNQARGSFGNIPTSHAQTLRVEVHRREASLAVLAQQRGIQLPGPFLPAPWNLRVRVLSWRLEGAQHPYPHDSALSLMRLQAQSLWHCPGYSWLERRAAQLWLLGMLTLPKRWVTRLAATNTSGGLRRWFRRLRPPSAPRGLSVAAQSPGDTQ